jgi:hypothetical protein
MTTTTEELEMKVKDLSIIASILARKSLNLDDKLRMGYIAYNPYYPRSLGRFTDELNQIIDIAAYIYDIARTL